MPDVTVDNHIKKDTIVKLVNTRKVINLKINSQHISCKGFHALHSFSSLNETPYL